MSGEAPSPFQQSHYAVEFSLQNQLTTNSGGVGSDLMRSSRRVLRVRFRSSHGSIPSVQQTERYTDQAVRTSQRGRCGKLVPGPSFLWSRRRPRTPGKCQFRSGCRPHRFIGKRRNVHRSLERQIHPPTSPINAGNSPKTTTRYTTDQVLRPDATWPTARSACRTPSRPSHRDAVSADRTAKGFPMPRKNAPPSRKVGSDRWA